MESERKGGKRVDATTLVLMIAASVLLVVAFLRERDLPLAGLLVAGRTLWRNLPLLLLGFAIAGLVQVVIPKDLVNRWLGNQTGFKGVLIGCVVGGLCLDRRMRFFPSWLDSTRLGLAWVLW